MVMGELKAEGLFFEGLEQGRPVLCIFSGLMRSNSLFFVWLHWLQEGFEPWELARRFWWHCFVVSR